MESPVDMIRTRTFPFVLALMSVMSITAQVTIADAGPDQELCSSNAFLQGNAPDFGEYGQWTLISGILTFNDPNDPLTGVIYAGTGENILQWTIFNGNESTTDLVSIWVFEGNAPSASAGFDITLVAPVTFAQLQGSPYSFPMTCQWSIVSGTGNITDLSDPFAMYSGANVGLNVVVWSCDNGPCGVTTDQVVITVEEAMAIGWLPAEANVRVTFDPHTERLSVTAPADIDRLILTDQMGRLVLDRSMNARSASLDVSALSIGAYVVRAVMDGTSFNERFVVVP